MEKSIKEMLLKKRIIIFDLDDTIIYTFFNGYLKIRQVERNMELSNTDFTFFRTLYGRYSFEECISRMHPEVDIQQFINEYYKAAEDIPYKAVMDMGKLLEKFFSKGIEVGILTNSENYDRVLNKLEIAGCMESQFLFIYSGEMLKRKKPAAEAFYGIEELRKYNSSEIAYIADGHSDQVFCNVLKIDFVAVGTGPYVWKKEEVCYYIESLKELEEIL